MRNVENNNLGIFPGVLVAYKYDKGFQVSWIIKGTPGLFELIRLLVDGKTHVKTHIKTQVKNLKEF